MKLLTQEDRDKIVQQRNVKKEWALSTLKTEYLDMPAWEGLSKKYSIRLPAFYHPTYETKYIKRICKATGVDIIGFVESTGFSTLISFAEANSSWNCRALCGILLEYIDEHKAYSTDRV